MFNYSQWLVDFLAKAAGHKYIKRIPYQSQGKTRYRYIYHVTHTAGGKHVLDPEHMVQGAAFMLSSAKGSEVHAHITKVDGDMVTYRLDDGPDKDKIVTESKSKLAARLNEEHGVHEALAGAREKQAKVVADLKARGASEKQVAREQARLERLSVSAPAPAPEAKSEEPESEERATVGPITQRGPTHVQQTTVEYSSGAAIPKTIQSALKRFVSNDDTQADMRAPFLERGYMYATDGFRALRVGVQGVPEERGDSPEERGGSLVERAFARARDNTPTVTLDDTTCTRIVEVCKTLDPNRPVLIRTRDGKTTFIVKGAVIAVIDAHVDGAPTQAVKAGYLTDMLSVEHPITILQHPNAAMFRLHPLTAHSASAQQIVMPHAIEWGESSRTRPLAQAPRRS